MAKNTQNLEIDEAGFNDSAFKVRLKRNLEILSNVLANPTTVLGVIGLWTVIGLTAVLYYPLVFFVTSRIPV